MAPLESGPSSRSPRTAAAQQASDYFNSLPIEQRLRLAPLLEDYRLLGMREYARTMDSARQRMATRMRDIVLRQEEHAPAVTGTETPHG